MRYLHTLKGGSNMIQARHIGLIAHELETIYEKLINQQIQASSALVNLIRAVQDDIADRIQTIKDHQVDYPSTHVLGLLKGVSASGSSQVSEVSHEQKAEQEFILDVQDQDQELSLNNSEIIIESDEVEALYLMTIVKRPSVIQ